MNEADKERFKREKELYDRGVAGGGVATVRVAAPASVQEAGTVQVGEANIFYVNIFIFFSVHPRGLHQPQREERGVGGRVLQQPVRGHPLRPGVHRLGGRAAEEPRGLVTLTLIVTSREL